MVNARQGNKIKISGDIFSARMEVIYISTGEKKKPIN